MDGAVEPHALEASSEVAKTPEAPQAPQAPKRKPKAPAAPPKPPPTPEELAAAVAHVQWAREQCAVREVARDAEREASRLATHTGRPRPGGQVYWSASGQMICGKCHLYCGQDATHEAAHCMGHAPPVNPAVIEEIRLSRIRSAELTREEEERRFASRTAGRTASRATAKANPWR